MARIQTSAIISNISGKVNGSVFQRNQGGLILRNQSAKINSNTTRSNSHRVGISTIQGYWQGLTDAERLLWSTYATYLNKKQKKNPTLNVNGHQLFLNINSIRYDLQFVTPVFTPTLLTTPILTPVPQPINITSLYRNGLALECLLDRNVLNADDVIILYISRPLSGSQMSAHVKQTLMKSPTTDGTTFECSAYYEEVYGRVIETGEWCQTRIAIYNVSSDNYSSYSVKRFEVG